MAVLDNLADKTFGRLTVLHRVPATCKSNTRWRCQCSCGQVKDIAGSSLRSGDSQSCGCVRKEVTGAKRRTHGRSKSKAHVAWLSLRSRCFNRNDERYSDYGGRGITVCDRWKDSFENFLTDMGEPPTPKHSIDRKDNNGNYEPDNCRWATVNEQANNKRDCRYYTYNGETLSLADWARRLGFKYRCLYSRIVRDGIPFEDAVSYPSGTTFKR